MADDLPSSARVLGYLTRQVGDEDYQYPLPSISLTLSWTRLLAGETVERTSRVIFSYLSLHLPLTSTLLT